jgi:hypothetical protein
LEDSAETTKERARNAAEKTRGTKKRMERFDREMRERAVEERPFEVP